MAVLWGQVSIVHRGSGPGHVISCPGLATTTSDKRLCLRGDSQGVGTGVRALSEAEGPSVPAAPSSLLVPGVDGTSGWAVNQPRASPACLRICFSEQDSI